MALMGPLMTSSDTQPFAQCTLCPLSKIFSPEVFLFRELQGQYMGPGIPKKLGWAASLPTGRSQTSNSEKQRKGLYLIWPH